MAGEWGSNGTGNGEISAVFRLRMYDGDRHVPYRVRRSPRASAIRLTIDRHYGVILTLPSRTPLREGLDFLQSKSAWLRRHLSRRPETETLHGYLERNGGISIAGRRLPLVVRRTGRKPVVRYNAGHSPVVVETGQNGVPERELAEVLRGLAARVLPSRTEELAGRHGFRVKRVAVRDQTSRWGSCSCSGTVSLNWRLLLVPPEIQDYVILHELAHLRQMDHSAAYWRELTALDPDARERDRWLNEFGEAVMALGRGRRRPETDCDE